DSAVISLDPSTGQVESLYRAANQISAGTWGPSVSISSDGTASAAVRSSFENAPEVWAGATPSWKQITQLTNNVRSAWGECRSINWRSDAFEGGGWLVYPAGFDPAKKHPLVVSVHGGPGAAVESAWPRNGDFGMALAAAGYFVLFPNPRGSFGNGEA